MMAAMDENEKEVPAVYLQDIRRQYQQGETTLTILDGASLALWAGQSVALVAPSGSGKSTLLHIAGLLEHPDEGEVYVSGLATSGLSDAERTQIRRTDVGFVYQSHRLLPEFTALENVMMPQLIRGLKGSEAATRSRELLAYLGLGERVVHRPSELSGGEQQRVAIARGLVNRPPVILADEPTAPLDSVRALTVIRILNDMAVKFGTAIIVVTHDEKIIPTFRRIYHIRDGVTHEEAGEGRGFDTGP